MSEGYTMKSTKLVLLDIDGVCADDSARVAYALTKSWDDYFERIHEDALLIEGRNLALRYYRAGYEVQYLTGRRIDLYEKTCEWLEMFGFPNPEKITMRGFADRDILARYKGRVIQNALGGGEYSEVLLYEDDPAVVAHVNSLARALNLNAAASLTDWYTKHPEMVTHAEI